MQVVQGSQPYARALELPRLVPLDWGSYAARLLIAGEKLFDLIAIVAAMYLANALHPALRQARLRNSSTVLLCGVVAGAVFVFLLERHGGYRAFSSLLSIRETERLLRVISQSFLVVSGTVYFLSIPLPQITMLWWAILAALFLLLEKREVYGLLCSLRRRGHGIQRALILGTGSAARRIYTSLLHSPKFGIAPVAFIDLDEQSAISEIYPCSYRRDHPAPVLQGPVNEALLRRLEASVIVISQPEMDRRERKAILREAAELGVAVLFVPEELFRDGCQLDYTDVDGITLAHVSEPQARPLYEAGKRILDVGLASVALLIFALFVPLLVLLVKKSSPGPVFFRQERIGKGGRPFTIYKIRTMYEEAPKYDYSPSQSGDLRVTPFGRFLRRTSLDEIPQLINVLIGQMSLVGPRPEMPFIVEQYTPEQRERLALKPGVTGLWQISADRAFPIHQHLEYDAYYAQHRSFFMDLAILLHSFPFAARGT